MASKYAVKLIKALWINNLNMVFKSFFDQSLFFILFDAWALFSKSEMTIFGLPYEHLNLHPWHHPLLLATVGRKENNSSELYDVNYFGAYCQWNTSAA